MLVSTLGTILITVIAFMVLILLLVALLLFTKEKLAPSGPVTITINGEKQVQVASGSTLLSTLGNQKIFLPSACGGGGTCIQCECHVLEGGGEALPTETPHFSKRELNEGARLACQVKVKQDMEITIPEEVFGIKKWEATVVSNYNVASFIKEFVVEIPEDMNYKPGATSRSRSQPVRSSTAILILPRILKNTIRQTSFRTNGINLTFGLW